MSYTGQVKREEAGFVGSQGTDANKSRQEVLSQQGQEQTS
jgi:hypothetical protein